MNLIITINLDNDAFQGGTGDEVSRILKKYCQKISETDYLESSIKDINGNTVGSAKITK